MWGGTAKLGAGARVTLAVAEAAKENVKRASVARCSSFANLSAGGYRPGDTERAVLGTISEEHRLSTNLRIFGFLGVCR
jgi:hypothetical protein